MPAGESLTLSSVGYQPSKEETSLPDPTRLFPDAASVITDASAFEMDLTDVKIEDYQFPHQKLEKHSKPLTKSEEQFFDVVRMRTTEVKVAHMRSIDFAKRVFKSKYVRADPQLSKLATVRMLCSITKWLFESLSKKLIVKAKTGYSLTHSLTLSLTHSYLLTHSPTYSLTHSLLLTHYNRGRRDFTDRKWHQRADARRHPAAPIFLDQPANQTAS